MKNKERFANEIFELCCSGTKIAVDSSTNAPISCGDAMCDHCLFKQKDCYSAFAEWCNEDYTEPCPFEKDELVEVSDDNIEWSLRYFDSMTVNKSFPHNEYPYKVYDGGYTSANIEGISGYKYCRKYGALGNLNIISPIEKENDILRKFLKWLRRETDFEEINIEAVLEMYVLYRNAQEDKKDD